MSANGRVRPAQMAATEILSAHDALVAAATLTRRAIDRALIADGQHRSFIDRDRAALDEHTLGTIRTYVAALKEVRT